jgi:hypothetical protein
MTVTDGNKMVQELAVDFEAAWKEESDLPDDCDDERMNAAVARTGVFVNRILRLRESPCLQVRVFYWGQSTSPEKFAEHADYPADRALAALFRDLGADYPIGGEGPDAGVSFPATAAA